MSELTRQTGALRRLFCAERLGIAHPADSRTFFEALQKQLPARGRPAPCVRPSARLEATLLASAVPSLEERLAALRDDARLVANLHAGENFVQERAEAEAARRHACATLIAVAVRRYLYLPGGGIMRRSMRELNCVEDDE